MTQLVTLRRIVLPQAMRVIIPPVGNEVISMVKLTSVASVIQYSEILRNAQTIYYANARVMELLIVAAIWYLAVVTVLSIGQYFLERRFARGRGDRRAQRRADRRGSRGLTHGGERTPDGRRGRRRTSTSAASQALKGIDLELAKGEVLCVIGPRDPARARSCAASTSSSAPTAARSGSTAS